MGLQIYGVAVDMVRQVRPLIERIASKDSNLADQMRRAASSVPLNIHEGAYSQGGHVRARFYNSNLRSYYGDALAALRRRRDELKAGIRECAAHEDPQDLLGG